MSGLKPSPWARASFGATAADLTEAVTLAIHQAHALAMAAHISSTLRSNDAYGATLHVAQYEQLVEHARDIPGISVRKPADVRCRFDLVVNDDPPVVLYTRCDTRPTPPGTGSGHGCPSRYRTCARPFSLSIPGMSSGS